MGGDEQRQHDEFLNSTIAALRAADGDMDLLDQAIRGYRQRGCDPEMSPMELWGYSAISYPGLPERAG